MKSKKKRTSAKKTGKPRAKAASARRPAKRAVKPAARRAPVKTPLLRDLADWRHVTLDRMRALILEADPDAIEERKWRKPSNPAGVPVWSHDGILCTGETYKDKVKLTFAKGASIADPARLFNSSLDGNTRRALDLFEGKDVDESAFKDLIRAAAAVNSAGGAAKPARKSKPKMKAKAKVKAKAKAKSRKKAKKTAKKK
jgi:hypothetical protein